MPKKAKQRFSWDRDATTGIIVKTDGLTSATFETDLSTYPQLIQDEIFVYGGSKIIDDRLSQVPASLKIQEAEKLVLQFMEGDWKAERTGGARFLPTVVEAIKKVKGCSIAAAQKAYRGLDDEQRIVIKENLAETIREIDEARKEEDVPELDDLLS